MHIAALFRQGDIASFENPKKLLYWKELNDDSLSQCQLL
jgi:hypothetical protein